MPKGFIDGRLHPFVRTLTNTVTTAVLTHQKMAINVRSIGDFEQPRAGPAAHGATIVGSARFRGSVVSVLSRLVSPASGRLEETFQA
jgi:hypothetical protein